MTNFLRLTIIITLAVLLSFLTVHVSPVFFAILPILLLIAVLYSVFTEKEGEAATVPAGSTIQWREMSVGRVPLYWVFLPVKDDQCHFYKVYSQELYDMGVGYMTGSPIEGIKVARP